MAPELRAITPEARARAELINQIHDLYIASPNITDPNTHANQAAMYKPVDVIDAPTRAVKIAEIAKQFAVLEGLVVGPYCIGELYPTFIYLTNMLPLAFGWSGIDGRPNLAAWFEKMEQLPAAKRVKDEMMPCLNQSRYRTWSICADH